MDQEKKPAMLPALLTMKCPNCRKGHVFVNKSVLPLNKCLAIAERCDVCGMKMVKETNNGIGINYVLTVMLMFLNALWYWPIFGLSIMDDSIFYFLGASVVVTTIAQPWLMRYSRMLYLYFTVYYHSHPYEQR